ncbi:MAG: RICIN domain-containing protein, partial [Pseudonocardiaceae bacterium]
PGRMWYLRRAVEGGTVEPLYHIVNASNGKCLSYSEKIVGEAHVVVQRSCAGGNDEGQLWKFSKYGDSSDGWISGWMVNMYSSKCLDINGGDVAEGTPSYSGSTTED